ncbi:four helix bundle protein [Mucilaginibacter ginkgonis]|uniref:Four helix bundle protein n=1 Tax=Mucilaginibacter ginkgonis TaxID=2682091 RepID=A0A7T7JIF2_9SPHI|nr:four helix bundle protein [Mucilaginibacter ginkgonis]
MRFCVVARGSLSETSDHLIIALDDNIITSKVFDAYYIEHESCLKLINGYILYLKNKKGGE